MLEASVLSFSPSASFFFSFLNFAVSVLRCKRSDAQITIASWESFAAAGAGSVPSRGGKARTQFQGNRSIQIAVSGELFDFHEGCWLRIHRETWLQYLLFGGWGDLSPTPPPIPWLSCFICLMLKNSSLPESSL